MPYIITEGRLPNTYMVINDLTGKVHAFGSSFENAKKQLGLLKRFEGLEHIEGDIMGDTMGNNRIEGTGLLYNKKRDKISLPSTNDIQFIVPPFLVREREGKNNYKLKLVNPLTKQRNISSREKDLNIHIFRKLTPTADLQFRLTDYDLESFSPADRKTLMEYDTLITDEWNGKLPKRYNKIDYANIPSVRFYNQPRGFPKKLPKNDSKPKRKGYMDVNAYLDGQDVNFNEIRPAPKKPRKKVDASMRHLSNVEEIVDEPIEEIIEEPIEEKVVEVGVEKKKRGRPRTRPVIAPEDKRPRGRPRTRPVIAPEDKRPRGRPRKKVETVGGKISSNSIMPNKWVQYVKAYASKKGIRYSDALKDPACSAGYKKGGMLKEESESDSSDDEGIHIDIGSHNQGQRSHQGGTLFKIEPGRITHQAGQRGVVLGSKRGRGVIDESIDYGILGKETKLGANAGRKFISL